MCVLAERVGFPFRLQAVAKPPLLNAISLSVPRNVPRSLFRPKTDAQKNNSDSAMVIEPTVQRKLRPSRLPCSIHGQGQALGQGRRSMPQVERQLVPEPDVQHSAVRRSVVVAPRC